MSKLSLGFSLAGRARATFAATIQAVKSAGPKLASKVSDVLKTEKGRASVIKAIPALSRRKMSGAQILQYVKSNPLNSFFALSMASDLVYLIDDLVASEPEFAAAAKMLEGVDTIDTLSVEPAKREAMLEERKASLAGKAQKIESLTVAQLREARDEVESLEMAIAAMPGDSELARQEQLRAIMRVVASGDEVFLLAEALESLK